MIRYHFRAVTASGEVRTGVLPAADVRAAAAELRRQGLTPVHVGLEAAPARALPQWSSIRARDIRFFTQEMSTLLSSGIPIDRALSIVAELTERREMCTVVLEVLRVLKGGRTLADSLAAHPKVFDELYVNLVRAGEAAGSLAAVFERLAEYEQSRDDLRSYMISALVYPVLLAVVGLASILVLLYFVVPRFAAMFEDGRMQIPLPTQIMLALSGALREYGWLALLGGAALASGLWFYVQTPRGRAWWHRWQLTAPVAGEAIRKAETARFARAMATLLGNGVPLVQSLSIAARILTNRWMAAAVDGIARGVKRGEGLAAPLSRSQAFPPLAGHLLAVGEETGRMDEMFHRMAEIFEADTRAAVKRFTSLFEPLLILVMGLAVGALILSMLLAITSINEVAL